MIIGITLDGIISSQYLYDDTVDDDLYCLNQTATESGWYASNRWFAKGHDVFFMTSRSNSNATNRWLDEWNLTFNNVFYNVDKNMHALYAQSLKCDIVVLDHAHNAPKLPLSCISFLLPETAAANAPSSHLYKLSTLDDLDRVINRWPTSKKDFIASPVE